jgi:hypothetical protein
MTRTRSQRGTVRRWQRRVLPHLERRDWLDRGEKGMCPGFADSFLRPLES